MLRYRDGSAGDADYGLIGSGYALYRRADPDICRQIEEALGDARTVLNVGAGAGSYEPLGREVTAVEPSASMRAQRPAHLPEAYDALAESLPFADDSFDAAMATFTVHQWRDVEKGLSEMRRVTKGPVIVMSCDPDLVQNFWLNHYAPRVLAAEARRYPTISRVRKALGGEVHETTVQIPHACTDGFNEAYFGRPESFLDPLARKACSAWSFVDRATVRMYVHDLQEALVDGSWDERYGWYRQTPMYEGSLRLIVSIPRRILPT